MIAALPFSAWHTWLFTSQSQGVGAFATTLRPKDGRENWRWSTRYGRATGLGRVHVGANYSRGEFVAGQFLYCAHGLWCYWVEPIGKFIRLCRILKGAVNQCPLAQGFPYFRWTYSSLLLLPHPEIRICFQSLFHERTKWHHVVWQLSSAENLQVSMLYKRYIN